MFMSKVKSKLKSNLRIKSQIEENYVIKIIKQARALTRCSKLKQICVLKQHNVSR